MEPQCQRCLGWQRVINGDGAAVCWTCVLAWGSYAALAAGATAPESGRDADAHRSHASPQLGCQLCMTFTAGLDPRSTER